jgi:hypothetical protein
MLRRCAGNRTSRRRCRFCWRRFAWGGWHGGPPAPTERSGLFLRLALFDLAGVNRSTMNLAATRAASVENPVLDLPQASREIERGPAFGAIGFKFEDANRVARFHLVREAARLNVGLTPHPELCASLGIRSSHNRDRLLIACCPGGVGSTSRTLGFLLTYPHHTPHPLRGGGAGCGLPRFRTSPAPEVRRCGNAHSSCATSTNKRSSPFLSFRFTFASAPLSSHSLTRFRVFAFSCFLPRLNPITSATTFPTHSVA